MEQTELAALVKELEDVEAAYLKPATERLRRENDSAQKRNLEVLTVPVNTTQPHAPFPADDLYRTDWAYRELQEAIAENRRLDESS